MSKNLTRLLLFTIFISGFCALTYQIVWLRVLHLIFGVHIYSTSAVLTAFMAGLATGSYLFGKLADRVKNPVNLYLFIEAAIFAYAIAFPTIFDLSSGFYLKFFSSEGVGEEPGNILRFLQAFLLLIFPTTLMGGTVPVVTKILVKNLTGLGKELSLIYALNNLGAAIGGIIAGFFLIRLIGMRETMYLAAILNLVNTIVLFFIRKSWNDAPEILSVEPRTTHKTRGIYPVGFIRLILVVFALEGFTTLAYEILWTRIFIEFSFDKTVYIYSVIIVGFIFGLSVGGFVMRRFINRLRDLPSFLAASQVGIAVFSFLLLMLFIYLSPILVQNRGFEGSWFSVSGKEYLLIFLILMVPVTLMGFTFPIVGKIVSDSVDQLGTTIGKIGFLDTVGSIFGSYIAGFIMIPLMGIYPSFLIVVLMNVLLGVLLLVFHPVAGRKRKVALGILIASFILILFAPGNKEYFEQRVKYYPEDKVLSYAEGVSATVSVHRLASGHKALAINGSKTAFTTSADLQVHTLLAYGPYLLGPGNDTALIIGYGMGVTAKCLADSPMSRIDIAELSPEVIHTARDQFSYLNLNVDRDEKVKIYYEDGRSFLLRSGKEYGLITSNAVHARLGANLYTFEFYEICRDRLSQNGFMCQWLPTNWMTETEFKSLVKSFIAVFPNSSLWYLSRGHMLLLGSQSTRKVDFSELMSRFYDQRVRSNLLESGIVSPAEFASRMMATSAELEEFVKGVKLNTDNHPLVEFSLETDLRPNFKILQEISELELKNGPEEFFRFPVDGVKFSFQEQIRYMQQVYREDLKSFARYYNFSN